MCIMELNMSECFQVGPEDALMDLQNKSSLMHDAFRLELHQCGLPTSEGIWSKRSNLLRTNVRMWLWLGWGSVQSSATMKLTVFTKYLTPCTLRRGKVFFGFSSLILENHTCGCECHASVLLIRFSCIIVLNEIRTPFIYSFLFLSPSTSPGRTRRFLYRKVVWAIEWIVRQWLRLQTGIKCCTDTSLR